MAGEGGRHGARIGLALSGGGARGLAHIPVVEALDELGLPPAVIAGTSMGAIVGAGRAAGMSGADIREFAISRLANRAEVLARLWQIRPRMQQLLSDGGFAIGQLDAERVLDVFMPEAMPRRFEDLRIPLKVVATDFYGQRQAVLDTGPLFPALAASAAIPILFRPVRIGGRIMVDGGVINPLPFDAIMDEADIVIAVDVVGGPADRHDGRMPGSIEAIYGATQLLMQAIMAEKMRGPRPPAIFVRPPVDARVLEFYKARQILDHAAPVKDEIKRLVEQALSPPRDREAVRSPGSI